MTIPASFPGLECIPTYTVGSQGGFSATGSLMSGGTMTWDFGAGVQIKVTSIAVMNTMNIASSAPIEPNPFAGGAQQQTYYGNPTVSWDWGTWDYYGSNDNVNFDFLSTVSFGISFSSNNHGFGGTYFASGNYNFINTATINSPEFYRYYKAVCRGTPQTSQTITDTYAVNTGGTTNTFTSSSTVSGGSASGATIQGSK